jgi:hypothetical protein
MDLDDLFALRLYFQDQYEDENDIIKELKYELVNQGLSEEDANNKLKEFYNTYGIDIDINIFEEIETPEDDLPELILNNNPFLNLLQNNNTFANLLNNNQGNNPFANLLNNNQGDNPFANLLNNNQGNNLFANLLNNNQGNILGNLTTQLQQLQTNNPENNSINNLLNQLQQLQNNNQVTDNQENNNPNNLNQQTNTNSIFILLNQLYQHQNQDINNNEDNTDNNEDDSDNNDDDNEDDSDSNNNLSNIFSNPSQNQINNLAALLLAGFNIAPPPPQDVICTLDETDKEKLSKYILTEDHTEKCNICLDILVTDQEVIKLPCEHLYHSECILEWLDKYNYKCPCCRNEVGKAKYNV